MEADLNSFRKQIDVTIGNQGDDSRNSSKQSGRFKLQSKFNHLPQNEMYNTQTSILSQIGR